jgi:hypothetical protein
VQQHKAGRHPKLKSHVVTGDEAAKQGEPLFLGDGLALAELEHRDVQAGHVALPDQEPADGLPLMDAVAEPEGVDVGLGDVGGLAAPGVDPGQDDLGRAETLLGVLAGGRPQRPGGGRHPTSSTTRSRKQDSRSRAGLNPSGVKLAYEPAVGLLTGNGPQAIDAQARKIRSILAAHPAPDDTRLTRPAANTSS